MNDTRRLRFLPAMGLGKHGLERRNLGNNVSGPVFFYYLYDFYISRPVHFGPHVAVLVLRRGRRRFARTGIVSEINCIIGSGAGVLLLSGASLCVSKFAVHPTSTYGGQGLEAVQRHDWWRPSQRGVRRLARNPQWWQPSRVCCLYDIHTNSRPSTKVEWQWNACHEGMVSTERKKKSNFVRPMRP
jgi:hypothetical protein